MTENIPPLFYALGATLSFAYTSTIFTEFAHKISSFWVSTFKVIVAIVAFWLTVFLLDNWVNLHWQSLLAFIASGCIGLMVSDILILQAMKKLGVARTLMIFGLQPFFLGIGGHYFFGQKFSPFHLAGVLLMLCCLSTISLEHRKKNGRWQLKAMLVGIAGIFLDASGILLTRYGFNHTPDISSAQVNAIRCIGALLGFILLNYIFYKKNHRIYLGPIWKSLERNERIKIIFASLGGTYFSLMLYLTAVARGQLSVISSVGVTGPMFAEIFECLRLRKFPSVYVFIAFSFFISGFFVFLK